MKTPNKFRAALCIKRDDKVKPAFNLSRQPPCLRPGALIKLQAGNDTLFKRGRFAAFDRRGRSEPAGDGPVQLFGNRAFLAGAV